MFTNHSAVRAVLQSSNANGKHACWWTNVYDSGIADLQIIYQSGRKMWMQTSCPDALRILHQPSVRQKVSSKSQQLLVKHFMPYLICFTLNQPVLLIIYTLLHRNSEKTQLSVRSSCSWKQTNFLMMSREFGRLLFSLTTHSRGLSVVFPGLQAQS